jgi:hypothetical protein
LRIAWSRDHAGRWRSPPARPAFEVQARAVGTSITRDEIPHFFELLAMKFCEIS